MNEIAYKIADKIFFDKYGQLYNYKECLENIGTDKVCGIDSFEWLLVRTNIYVEYYMELKRNNLLIAQ